MHIPFSVLLMMPTAFGLSLQGTTAQIRQSFKKKKGAQRKRQVLDQGSEGADSV
jgi:hypothetical protein